MVPLRGGAPPPKVEGIDRVFSPCRYEGVVRDLVLRLKTFGDRHPVAALADLLEEACRDPVALGRPDGVVAVPASPWRKRRRGFDQAELLAQDVARRLDVPFLRGAVRRVLFRPRQAALDRDARIRNAVGLFRDAERVFGRAVLLVDDVSTTGATLSAAAAALRRGGARRVTALVVASVD
jgi:ComF family protein